MFEKFLVLSFITAISALPIDSSKKTVVQKIIFKFLNTV
jgi:hypothetical protein